MESARVSQDPAYPAWVALNDRLATYFTGMRLNRLQFILERGDLYPGAA